MNKAAKFWNRFADHADLVDESMPGQTIVEITGFSRVLIETTVVLQDTKRIGFW